MLQRLIPLLVRRRVVAVSVAIVFVLVMLLLATRLRIDNSLEVWFVDDDPTLVSYREFLQQFGNDEVVVTAIHGAGDVFDPGRLSSLAKLTRAIEDIEGVERVRSLANSVVAQPGPVPMVSTVVVQPVEDDDVRRARTAVANGGLGSMYVGKDGKTLVVLTWMEASATIDTERGAIIAAIRAAADASLGSDDRGASHGGLGVVYDALNRTTLGEGAVFILLSYVVMFVVLYLIMRRLLWTFVALVAVTFADIALLGTMSLLGRPVNMITMALPPLVMILGVANVVHMATDLDIALSKNRRQLDDLMRCLAAIATPCFFNALTTAVAFLSLTTASMAVTRDYGLFAACGVVLAFVFSLIGMAAVLPRVTRFRPPGRLKVWMARLVEGAMIFSLRRRTAVVVFTVVVLAVALWGARGIIIDTYSIDFLPKDHPARFESDAIEETVGPYVPLEMTVRTADKGGWQRAAFLARLAAAQKALEADPALGRTITVGDVLHDLHMAASGEVVERPWAPASDEEVLPLLTMVEMSGRRDALNSLVAPDDQTVRLTATTPMASVRRFMEVGERAKDEVEQAFAGTAEVSLSGYLPLYGQMIVHILDDQIRSFSLAFLMVFFVVSLVLRSWRFTLVAIPPNLIPVAVVAGVMGFVGIRLDIATVTIAAVVLGIIVDDTVHILYRLRQELATGLPLEEAMRRVARASGVAVVSTSIVFCAGFLVIALAGAYSIANVGLLTAVAVAAALITDLLLLPAFASFLLGGDRK